MLAPIFTLSNVNLVFVAGGGFWTDIIVNEPLPSVGGLGVLVDPGTPALKSPKATRSLKELRVRLAGMLSLKPRYPGLP